MVAALLREALGLFERAAGIWLPRNGESLRRWNRCLRPMSSRPELEWPPLRRAHGCLMRLRQTSASLDGILCALAAGCLFGLSARLAKPSVMATAIAHRIRLVKTPSGASLPTTAA